VEGGGSVLYPEQDVQPERTNPPRSVTRPHQAAEHLFQIERSFGDVNGTKVLGSTDNRSTTS
jgi:hypothetical protein